MRRPDEFAPLVQNLRLPGHENMAGRTQTLVFLTVVTILFGVAIATRHDYNPWISNLIAGGVGLSLSLLVLRRDLRRLLVVHWKSACIAVTVGLGMVLATHVGYRLATWLVPELRAIVEALYVDVEQTSPALSIRVGLIVFIVVAEEFVWRGLALTLLPSDVPTVRTVLIGTALYALPQVIGGSWLLLCAALAVGCIFAIQREVYGRLTESLISHGIWSVAVFGVVPLHSY